MPNLTTKELSALEDQLNFERVICCKYQDAAKEVSDTELKTTFTQYATQHKNNYDTLLGFLK